MGKEGKEGSTNERKKESLKLFYNWQLRDQNFDPRSNKNKKQSEIKVELDSNFFILNF